MSDLTGARATYLMLKRAGTEGVHSREIIASRIPGATNPSERLREIADHVPLRKRSERHGRSPGVRAWLAEYAPDDAIPVTPAHGTEGGGGTATSPAGDSPAPLSAAASQTGTGAGNAPTRDGSAVERLQDKQEVAGSNPVPGSGQPLSVEAASEQVGVKQRVALVRDWDGVWRELPIGDDGWVVDDVERRAA